jgi:nitroreductase/NAD-dependent dihydropyrimidine dehydrogenase PreA subunit
MSLFIIDHKKCHRDGLCVTECPGKLIEIVEEEGFPTPIAEAETLCINCGHCVAICPHGALSLNTMSSKDCSPVRKELALSAEQGAHFLRSRRSTRNFKEKKMTPDLLTQLIDIARYAPSGHNLQPVHWLVITDSQEVHRMAGLVADWMRFLINQGAEMAQAYHMDRVVESWDKGVDRILRSAPHLVIAYGLKSLPTAQNACTIALTYLELAASSFGLGTCWAGYFNAAANFYPPLSETLALPAEYLPYGAMMVGYPKYTYQRIPLRNPAKIIWR